MHGAATAQRSRAEAKRGEAKRWQSIAVHSLGNAEAPQSIAEAWQRRALQRRSEDEHGMATAQHSSA